MLKMLYMILMGKNRLSHYYNVSCGFLVDTVELAKMAKEGSQRACPSAEISKKWAKPVLSNSVRTLENSQMFTTIREILSPEE